MALPTRAALAALCWPFAALAQGPAEAGFRVMADGNAGNCFACHALAGQPGVQSTFGPPLDKVGARYGEAQLRQWVTDARRLHPGTLMPPFGTLDGTQRAAPAAPILTAEQITQVVAALLSLR